MKFVMQIVLGNDSMKDGHDVRKKLVELSEDHFGPLALAGPGDQGLIRDRDGNTVGYWKVTTK